LAHIYRYDWVAQIIVHFAAIIYWYHPLIWLAKREVRKESDRAADDVALATGMSATKYAEQLLNVARSIAARWLHPAPAIVRRSQLARRISVLLDERRNRSKLNRRQSVIATVLTLCLVIPVSVVSVTTAEEAATSPFAREKLGDANKSLERERTAEEQELLEKQRGLLRVAVLETRKAYDLGTRSLDDYLRVVDRALAIELLLCKTPQEIANVRAQHVRRAMDLENEIEAKNRIGARGGSQRKYLAAKNARLKAEIGLERERTQIENDSSSSNAKKLLALLCEYRRDVSQQNVDAAKRKYLLGVIEADILVRAINDRMEAESLVSINPKERILVLQKYINDLSWLAQAVGEKLKIGARGGKRWLNAYCRATHAQAELLLLRSQMNADPQKTNKTSTAMIDQLLDQRDQGFEERVAAIRVEYQIGNAGVEEVLDGLADRLTSRLDREMTKQQRIQLCKQYLADTAKLENEVAVKAKISARGGDQDTLLFTRAERIGAEIELSRAKSQNH